MKRNHVNFVKQSLISLLVVLGIIGIVSINRVDGSGGKVQATEINRVSDAYEVPAHPYAYKLGDAMDIEGSINNYERINEKQRQRVKAQRDAVEAKQLAAKKAAEEKALAEETAKQQAIEVSEKKKQEEVKTAQENEEAKQTAVKPAQSASQPQAAAKVAPAPAPAQKSAPKPAPQPKPAPKQAPKPAIGSNKIGINGNYKSYTNYGRASTDKLQSGIDAGLIVGGLNTFNGNDGETTYFGGHNPGIMNFMAGSIRIGATITVTDSNGQEFNYKMIDKVDVDEYGEGVLKSIGVSAIDAYMYGTGSESILIQFCNTNNNLMSFWYGVKI